MYVYKQTQLDPDLWTVGFYDPNGKWEPESDHESSDKAAERVHYLNGGRQREVAAMVGIHGEGIAELSNDNG